MGKIGIHNQEMRASAKFKAEEMKAWPSPLEERMQQFLDDNWVFYQFQKIFYITADNGYILRYYIADFYIPEKKIIIEVDGKFHDNQRQHDRDRTRAIQKQYPGIEVIRFTFEDLRNDDKLRDLLHRIS